MQKGVLVLSIRGRKERKIAFVLPQKRSWHNTLVVFQKWLQGLACSMLENWLPSPLPGLWSRRELTVMSDSCKKKKRVRSGIWGFAEGTGRGILASALERVGVRGEGCAAGDAGIVTRKPRSYSLFWLYTKDIEALDPLSYAVFFSSTGFSEL